MGKISLNEFKEFNAKLIKVTNDNIRKTGNLKKSIDNIIFAIDKIEKNFLYIEKKQKEQEILENNKKLESSHITSYIMPDDNDIAEEKSAIDNSNEYKKKSALVDEPIVQDDKTREQKNNNRNAFQKDLKGRKPANSDSQDKRNSSDKKNNAQKPFNNTRNDKFAKNRLEKDKDEVDDIRRKPQTKAKPKPTVDFAVGLEKEKVSNYDPNKKSYERRDNDFDAKKKSKKIKVNQTYMDDDDDGIRGSRKAHSAKKKDNAEKIPTISIDKATITSSTVTVRDLSAKIGKQANEILKQLLLIGVMANINSELDFDTASLVATELGVELEQKLEQSAEEKLLAIDTEDDDDSLEFRPPVITIMGHVDHGKTSLLDYIRKSQVASGEAGGITQHIGAYMVKVNDKPITFLDTPGHEAFTSMRARGAQATDIAIIVVAANDGVMPQTVEAISHAKAAEVPIIIAINKMDLEHANPERVKQELTNYELIPEEWGGDTIMVPISAQTGMGIDNLLEMILLVAEVQQYKANPNRLAKGIIIEAKLDKSRGPLATVLIKTGTLKIGDNIVAGVASGNVRLMLNDRGGNVTTAGPSTPVEISGFDVVPEAGDELIVVEDSRLARTVVAERKDKEKANKQNMGNKVTLENLFTQIDKGNQVKLNVIIKADVQGSVEAVKQALEKLSNEDVKVSVLHSAVGAITDADVNLANAFNAIIIGFNIRPNASAKEKALKDGVDIKLYKVIYKAIEELELAMKGMLDPEFEEVELGHAEVRDTFRITGVGTVAGCYVTDGKMMRNASVRLLRDNIVIFEGKLSSLKRYKDDAKEVAHNFECGISLEGYNDIKNGDIIECFIEQEKK